MLLDDFAKLKRLMDEHHNEEQRLRGALAEIDQTLLRDHGFKSVQEAEDALEELKDKELILTDRINKAWKTLKEEHKDHPVIKKLVSG